MARQEIKPVYHADILETAPIPVKIMTCPAKSFTTKGCELLDDSDLPGQQRWRDRVGAPANQQGLRPYIQMSAISVKSATISNPSVGPGQPVVVKANVTNSGTGNGVARITVYVNGVEESAQPATLASGQSSTLDFTVTRNEPGTYSVIVNNVPAGSFTVELFNSNDMLIYGSVALFAVGFIGVLYMLTRKRKTA